MKWIIHKLRRPGNDRPWIAYTPHRASAFATFAEAVEYANEHAATEATA